LWLLLHFRTCEWCNRKSTAFKWRK